MAGTVTLYSKKNNRNDDDDDDDEKAKEDDDVIFESRNEEGDDDDDEEEEATVIRRKKRKGGRGGYKGYKVLDNRDSLPFQIRVTTPDPYTNKELSKRQARHNTKKEREKKSLSNDDIDKKSSTWKRSDMRRSIPIAADVKKNSQRNKEKMGKMRQSDEKDGKNIASSLYNQNSDGTLDKILGEFFLDKSTNCGDVVVVGMKQFAVQRARCQYKYVGGKQFVMVRKILEVKEVKRIADEAYLKRQFDMSSSKASSMKLPDDHPDNNIT